MLWQNYSRLRGKHSFLSPSSNYWLNYDAQKMMERYFNSFAQDSGTNLHQFAEEHIKWAEYMLYSARTFEDGSKVRANDVRLLKNDKKEVRKWLFKNHIPTQAVDLDFAYPNLQAYVNDEIDLRMDPEVILYYSEYCFGTADCISFENNLLRIHDLKTGKTPAHMEQLLIYAALFCLNYGIRPGDISFELRIYQNNEINVCNPTEEDISPIMDKIIYFDRIIQETKEGSDNVSR